MPHEIERKFLVKNDDWRDNADSTQYRQGYLNPDPNATVRVRSAGVMAWLTIKSKPSNLTRDEFEYPIPVADAEEMLDRLCTGPLIEKIRHKVEYAGKCWEIDEFQGRNQGLILAELELEHPDESFERPPWLGDEVTDDPRYFNSELSANPFQDW